MPTPRSIISVATKWLARRVGQATGMDEGQVAAFVKLGHAARRRVQPEIDRLIWSIGQRITRVGPSAATRKSVAREAIKSESVAGDTSASPSQPPRQMQHDHNRPACLAIRRERHARNTGGQCAAHSPRRPALLKYPLRVGVIIVSFLPALTILDRTVSLPRSPRPPLKRSPRSRGRCPVNRNLSCPRHPSSPAPAPRPVSRRTTSAMP